MKTFRTLLIAGVVAVVLGVTGAFALGSALITTPDEAAVEVANEIAEEGGDPAVDPDRQPEAYGTR